MRWRRGYHFSERERESERERAGETNKTQAHPGFANQTDQVDMD